MTAPRSPLRTLAVAGVVALVSAGLVTTAQVLLSPRIAANLNAERAARMQDMMARIPGLSDLVGQSGAAALLPRLVTLQTGQDAPGDPLAFDPLAAAQDAVTGRDLPPEADIAQLGRIATTGAAYVVQDAKGGLALVVLPFMARGYQSLIRGFVALQPDLTTIAALNITEQGETPGLGSRVQTPDWQALWAGRQIKDSAGTLAITVQKGGTTENWQVDALSGATRSSQAVGNGLRFWLGPDGYGPFLDRLRQEAPQ